MPTEGARPRSVFDLWTPCDSCGEPQPPSEALLTLSFAAMLGVEKVIWRCGLCRGWPFESSRTAVLE